MVTSQSALKNDWIIICGPVRNFFVDDFDLRSKIIDLDKKGNSEKKHVMCVYMIMYSSPIILRYFKQNLNNREGAKFLSTYWKNFHHARGKKTERMGEFYYTRSQVNFGNILCLDTRATKKV